MIIRYFANLGANHTISKAESAKTHRLGGEGPLVSGPLGVDPGVIDRSIYNCDRQINKKNSVKIGNGFCFTAFYNAVAWSNENPENYKLKYFLLPLLLGGVMYTADFIRYHYYSRKQFCLQEYLESKGLTPLR